MKEKIERALQALIGLPLLAVGRAVTLQWFHFGAERTVLDRKGKPQSVGEYALHTEKPWRILGPDGILTGSGDRYYPAGDPTGKIPPDFNWLKQGANRADARTTEFMNKWAQAPLIVEDVWADAVGSIRLTFSHGFALEVFPNDSLPGEYSEHWRLFQPYSEAPHYVLTGSGLEEH